MCKGLEGIREDGRLEGLQAGRQEGISLGERMKIKSLVEKKLQRGETAEKIADDLLEDISVIKGILYELELGRSH